MLGEVPAAQVAVLVRAGDCVDRRRVPWDTDDAAAFPRLIGNLRPTSIPCRFRSSTGTRTTSPQSPDRTELECKAIVPLLSGVPNLESDGTLLTRNQHFLSAAERLWNAFGTPVA